MNEPDFATATTCAYCGVGCGIQARPGGDNRSATVQGLADHPANFGRLCSKGSALGETLGQDDRLLHPFVDGRQVSWDTALDTLTRRFRETLETWGPDSVAFYLSGQLLTEDYYVANKLMKGFIGSANVDTNSRLCMSSSVSGHTRAFGSDTVPNCYEDLELADLVILTGSNLAWCHPVLFQRLRDARARRPEMKIVVIDPRRTDTCDLADLHLALRPGTDGWLFTGLLAWLGRQGALDYTWLEAHTEGFGPAIRQAQQLCPDLHSIAEPTGLSAADISRFFSWFVTRERTLTLYSQGIHQTSSGTDKVNAIINCHLATGRIGKPGSGLLSLTGQPNAMGGREVGGLATQLAAHLPFTGRAVEAVREFWQAPAVVTGPGKTATEIFDAMHRGEIRAIWIMGTNPAVSLPDGNRVREALARCPLVVVSEVSARADTLNYAHIRLPAAGWGEKNGTVTNSERRISRQRPFLPLPGEARPDWWMLTEVARRLGFGKAFDYRHPADIFREHAALSGWRNTPDDLPRTFNISALADISVAQYDALTPIQWPVTESAPCGTARLFGDGGFPTASGKARMLSIEPRGPARPPTPEYPFSLLTGRIRDQWHTMTRTALAPRLNQHEPEPVLSLHPLDARELALEPGQLVRVCSDRGEAVLRVRADERMRCGQVFAPMHWSAELAPFSRINTVIPAIVDPVSKQPEYKHTPVRLEPVKPAAWLTLVSATRPRQPENVLYQAHVRLAAGWHAISALSCPPADLCPQWLVSLLSETDHPGTMEWLEYHDAAHQVHRYAALREGRLVLVAYLSPEPPEDSPGWLHDALGEAQLDTLRRMSLLAGRPLSGGAGQGRTVCACFGVGEQRILALREDGVTQVEEICQRTQAGTNCGSCLPEIRRLLR